MASPLKRATYGLILAALLLVAALLVSTPVAPAAFIDCPVVGTCFGTDEADDINGTDGYDEVRAREGSDDVRGYGTGDDLLATVRDYRAELPGTVEGSFQPGGHDYSYWRSILPEVLSFLGRNLG